LKRTINFYSASQLFWRLSLRGTWNMFLKNRCWDGRLASNGKESMWNE
jgi:hypothetical protein